MSIKSSINRIADVDLEIFFHILCNGIMLYTLFCSLLFPRNNTPELACDIRSCRSASVFLKVA